MNYRPKLICILLLGVFIAGCGVSLKDTAYYVSIDGDYDALITLLKVETDPNETPARKAEVIKYLENLSPKGKKALNRVLFRNPDRFIQAYAIRHISAYKDKADVALLAKYLLKKRKKPVIYDNPDPLIEASVALATYPDPKKIKYIKDIYGRVSDPDYRILLIKSLKNVKGEKVKEINKFLLGIIEENKKYPKVEAAIFDTIYPEYEVITPTLMRAGHRMAFIVDSMIYGTKNLSDADLALQYQTACLLRLAKAGHLDSDTTKQAVQVIYKGFLRLPKDYRTYTKPLREIKRNIEDILKELGIDVTTDIEVNSKGGFLE